jgi:hypothetical protein
MDFKGQVAVLSAFVLVGMILLVPTITEKALALTFASATGMCGPEGQRHPCELLLINKDLSDGKWNNDPTRGPSTSVSWYTSGKSLGGREEGYATYQVGDSDYNAKLIFFNPAIWDRAGQLKNKCNVEIMKQPIPFTQNQVKYPPLGPVTGSCRVLSEPLTQITKVTYTLSSPYNWKYVDRSHLYKHLID